MAERLMGQDQDSSIQVCIHQLGLLREDFLQELPRHLF